MSGSQLRLVVLMFAGAYAFAFFWSFPPHSPDLMASWLAGVFLAEGRPDQVYAPLEEWFRMYPPGAWRPYMAEHYGYEGAIYPFLYPPLWARLGALLAEVNFWRVAAVALAVNTGLLLATVWLAWRACRPAMNPLLFMGLGIFFLGATHLGTIALLENQPQILASFLLVLAAERLRHAAPATAGGALALAAALKLYPALLALLWLAGRRYRAFVWFLAIGAGLALASIAWAGWPLHTAFIAQLRQISASVLVTGITFNLDATLAQLFFSDSLQWTAGLEPPTPAVPRPGWYTMARPPLWQLGAALALLAAMLWLARLFARAGRDIQVALLWPLALTVIPLLSPISWVYYYIPTACFAPVLIERLGTWRGGLFLLVGFGLLFGPFIRFYRDWGGGPGVLPFIYQLLGTLAIAILATGFLLAARRTMRPG